MLALVSHCLLVSCTSINLSSDRPAQYHTLKQGQPSKRSNSSAPIIRGDERGSNDSQVRLITTGYTAFEDRLRLIQSAQHSIDIQSFAWKPGISSRILAYQLHEAAERGVKVRGAIR